MSIQFECKKCGKTIKRDEKKYGTPVRCSECHSVNKTPGIALQNKVSSQQLDRMRKTLNWHRQILWIFWLSLPVLIIATAALPFIGLVFFIVALLFLDCTSKSSKYLGRSPVVIFLWFVMFSPVFLVLGITSYLRLKKRIAILQEAEVLGD